MPWPSLSEVKAANWDHLRANAAYWTNIGRTWEAAFTEIREAAKLPGGTEWTGPAAETFQDRADTDLMTVRSPVEMLDNAAAIATRGADAQDANKRLLLDAVDEAQRADFTVAGDYTATDARIDYSGPDEYFARKQAAIDHTDYIKFRVDNLVTNEDNIARQLAAATAGLCEFGFGDEGFDGGAGSAEARGMGAPPDDPTQFTRWWNELSQDQKDAAYAADHSIGNHPGIPWTDRDHYNRQHLPEIINQSQGDVDRLRAAADRFTADQEARRLPPPLGNPLTHSAGDIATTQQWSDLQTRLARAQRDLDGYRNVEQTLNNQPANGPHRYLAYLDDHGHAAVSLGDPDTAKRNATFVPGTGDDLTSMDKSVDRASAMHDAALDANPSLGPDDVSVTAWLGYDRPMSVIPQAMDPGYAHSGAAALDSFEAGMRASHQGAPSLDTVIGHSYGSTLTGAAATDGHLDANQLVAVGSPGLLADHASDLNLAPGAEVFAMRAHNDFIGPAAQLTPELGPDPTGAGFGATRLATDPGSPGPLGLPLSGETHGSYWDRGSTAVGELGIVIAGTAPPHPGAAP